MIKRLQRERLVAKGLSRARFRVALVFILISTGLVFPQRSRPVKAVAPIISPQQDDKTLASARQIYEEGLRQFYVGTSASMQLAIKKFEETLPLWRKLGDRRTEAVTLSLIGKAYDTLGEMQKALDYYDASLPILREVKDARSEANTLNNIGLIHDARGDKQKALEFYGKALAILSNNVDPGAEGITLVNIGLTYDSLGEKQKALNYYLRALLILRTTKDRKSEGVTLNNIGRVYDSLGDKDKAIVYFNQALPILDALGDARLKAITLNNVGYVHDSLGDKKKALEYYQQALPVLRAAGDRFKEAVTINNIGLVYYSNGQLDKALDYFTQALNLRGAIGDRPGVATTLGDTGMVYEAMGQSRKALEYYTDSLRQSRFVEDRVVEAQTLRRIALLEMKRGNLPQARVSIEASLAIVESLHRKISSQELRSLYLASMHEHFETYISILMEMHRRNPSRGYDALALKTNERARARSMLEMLTEARADIRKGVEPALLERERVLGQKISEAAERQTKSFAERRTLEQAATYRKMSKRLLREFQEVEAEIRAVSPRYAALTQPEPLGVKQIQEQTLDQNSLLLEYSLGSEKSFLWVVTPTGLTSFELPPKARIEAAALLVQSLLTARNRQVKFETVQERTARVESADKEFPDAALRLTRMLLGPVAPILGSKRLLIVGDGILDYIPFAALPRIDASSVGKYEPMIVNHEIVSLPSASTLALLRQEMIGRETAAKTLAVIADPVFDKNDSRIKPSSIEKVPETRGAFRGHGMQPDDRSKADFPSFGTAQEVVRIQRLPFTRIEANQILELVPDSESRVALDFDANRAVATSPELGKYRYVHFATHGVLDSEQPELSGIVLSLVNRDGVEQDGFLWTHEVFNLHLPVEMVVLSGCRTGLGKAIKGEGLVGLTRGFMYAGARRVVVSLWDISDESSAELMTQFYKGILGKDRLRPAGALRAAQLAVWKDQRWQAPFYWAAFVIQGEAN